MRLRDLAVTVLVCALAFSLTACSGGEAETEGNAATATSADGTPGSGSVGNVVAAFPIDSLDGVVDADIIAVDAEGYDGTPALLMEVSEPTTYHLFETGDLDIENGLVVYTAKVKTDGADGDVLLEMWCVFDDMGEFFSRGLDSTVSGTTDWTELRAVFRLEAGQNPDDIKLNVVAGGAGRVWVDDVVVALHPAE